VLAPETGVVATAELPEPNALPALLPAGDSALPVIPVPAPSAPRDAVPVVGVFGARNPPPVNERGAVADGVDVAESAEVAETGTIGRDELSWFSSAVERAPGWTPTPFCWSSAWPSGDSPDSFSRATSASGGVERPF